MSDKTTRKTPSKLNLKSKRAITWAIIVIASVALLFGVYEVGRYNNKWGEPDTLRMIKKEKMASDDLLGLELISYRQDGEGSLIGKTVTPSVTREFRVSNDEIDTTVQEIIRLAEADGWKQDSTLSNDNEWWGRKTKDSSSLATIVRVRNNHIEVTVLDVGATIL